MLLPPPALLRVGLESDTLPPPPPPAISNTSPVAFPQIHSEHVWRQLGPGQGEIEAGLGPSGKLGSHDPAKELSGGSPCPGGGYSHLQPISSEIWAFTLWGI